MTTEDLKTLARGLADGVTTLRLAEEVGVGRIVLRRMMERGDLLREMAEALASPDELGEDRLARLLTMEQLPGERIDNVQLRLKFAEEVRRAFPSWFARRRADEAAKAERAASDAAREERLARRRERAAARREAVVAECLAADFWNLRALCEMQRREWETGTPDERRRRLRTPQQLERSRRRRGITWGCAGFGIYYAPTWSAARCAMAYDIGDTCDGFTARCQDSQYLAVWRELEDEQAEEILQAYNENPLKRRDPKLPTTVAAAKALCAKLGLDVTG